MKDKLSALVQSRRFWAAVAGVVVVIGNDALGLGLEPETVTMTIVAIVGWIVGDSIDKTKRVD